MITDLGELNVLVNGSLVDYELRELKLVGRNFKVNGRVELLVENLESYGKSVNVECGFKSLKNEQYGSSESGEQLEMISFYDGDYKLSIGVEDEIDGLAYSLSNCSIVIRVNDTSHISNLKFRVAWIDMKDSKVEDIYTWFAADPTISSD